MNKSNNKTAIAIYSIYSFPEGLAPTTRILAYSKGLLENDATVDIFHSNSRRKTSGFEKSESGTYEGISYHFTYQGYKIKSTILRKITSKFGYRRIKSYILFFVKIRKVHKNKHFRVLIISSDSPEILLFCSLVANFLKMCPIFIFDEYPTPIRHKLKQSIPFWKKFLYKIILNQMDAFISISENLKEYFCQFAQKPTFILPVITDISRFAGHTKEHNSTKCPKYLCYMGNMELAKDDINTIIRAFSLVVTKHKDLFLYLYGNPTSEARYRLSRLISELDCDRRVIFKGIANFSEVPQILKEAFILVSSQPDTKRASGGFPTKLGEYLASGKPALITDVGENSKYVVENVHIYFAKPGDYKLYAKKLLYIIENYERALNVAAKGQKYLINNYSHSQKGCELLRFLDNIYENKYGVKG